MYVGKDYDPSDSGESEPYTLDFVNDLVAGETLASATWTCAVVAGVDASAASHVSGSASVSVTQTSQQFSGFVVGVKYRLQAVAITSAGSTKSLWSHVLCQTPK